MKIAVVIDYGGELFRVIDDLRALVPSGPTVDRTKSEQTIGRKVLDAARRIETENREPEKPPPANWRKPTRGWMGARSQFDLGDD
jgi:hypothetical protein